VVAWRVVGLYPERSRERALGRLVCPMIGRDAELGVLLGALGVGSSRILVVAPPGVGKTRLLTEFAIEAGRRGSAILRARLRPDLLSPFEPVGQLLRSVAKPSDVGSLLGAAGMPVARAEVVHDALESVIAPVEASKRFDNERDRLFAAWLEGLDAVAGSRQAVWLIEDLHWGSGDLLAFLDLAGHAPTGHG
jgi:hypothetical protein